MNKTISVANDFSVYPAGRTPKDGEHCGESFRELVNQHINESDHLKIKLDGTRGYSAAFLEEAFGGLIRETGMSYEEFKEKVEIISDGPTYDFYRDASYHFAEQAAIANKGRRSPKGKDILRS